MQTECLHVAKSAHANKHVNHLELCGLSVAASIHLHHFAGAGFLSVLLHLALFSLMLPENWSLGNEKLLDQVKLCFSASTELRY